MERFVFRPINLADIAATLGKTTTELRMTTGEDGVIEIETPNLTAANRTALRSMFVGKGYVEDPAL